MYQCDNSKVSCDNIVDESVSRKHCNSENEGEYEFADIHAARLKFVENIVRRDPTQDRFLKGWKNRINDIKFEA